MASRVKLTGADGTVVELSLRDTDWYCRQCGKWNPKYRPACQNCGKRWYKDG